MFFRFYVSTLGVWYSLSRLDGRLSGRWPLERIEHIYRRVIFGVDSLLPSEFQAPGNYLHWVAKALTPRPPLPRNPKLPPVSILEMSFVDEDMRVMQSRETGELSIYYREPTPIRMLTGEARAAIISGGLPPPQLAREPLEPALWVSQFEGWWAAVSPEIRANVQACSAMLAVFLTQRFEAAMKAWSAKPSMPAFSSSSDRRREQRAKEQQRAQKQRAQQRQRLQRSKEARQRQQQAIRQQRLQAASQKLQSARQQLPREAGAAGAAGVVGGGAGGAQGARGAQGAGGAQGAARPKPPGELDDLEGEDVDELCNWHVEQIEQKALDWDWESEEEEVNTLDHSTLTTAPSPHTLTTHPHHTPSPPTMTTHHDHPPLTLQPLTLLPHSVSRTLHLCTHT